MLWMIAGVIDASKSILSAAKTTRHFLSQGPYTLLSLHLLHSLADRTGHQVERNQTCKFQFSNPPYNSKKIAVTFTFPHCWGRRATCCRSQDVLSTSPFLKSLAISGISPTNDELLEVHSSNNIFLWNCPSRVIQASIHQLWIIIHSSSDKSSLSFQLDKTLHLLQWFTVSTHDCMSCAFGLSGPTCLMSISYL